MEKSLRMASLFGALSKGAMYRFAVSTYSPFAAISQLLNWIANGEIAANGEYVDTANRYIAPFDNAPNKLVISGDENGATVATISNNFLQHITALPVDGTRIDTAFAPDGSRLVTTTDAAGQFDWFKEIAAVHPDGLLDNIVVNDDSTVRSASYDGVQLAGDIGSALGSSLGRLLGGNSLVGQLATGTVIGAIGKEVGTALTMGASFDVELVVENALGTLAGGNGIGSLPAGAIGAISSLLM